MVLSATARLLACLTGNCCSGFVFNQNRHSLNKLLRWVFCFGFLLTLGFCSAAFGQSQGFVLVTEGADLQPYSSALSEANLEPYRLQKTDRTLTFDDGVEFKLLSAERLISSGLNLSLANYPTKQDLKQEVSLIFKLGPQGQIAVRSVVDASSKQAKIGAGFPSKTRTVISKPDFEKLPEAKQNVILSRPHQFKIE